MKHSLKFFTSIVCIILFIGLGYQSSFAFIGKSKRQKARPVVLKKAAPTTIESMALAHYATGIIYDNEGKIDKAIEEYQKALKYNNE